MVQGKPYSTRPQQKVEIRHELRTLVTAQRDRFERIKDDELSALRSELEAAVKADLRLSHALSRFVFDPYAFCETEEAAVPLDPESIRDQMQTFSCSKARAFATTILDHRAEFISTSIALAPERAAGYAEQHIWNLSESRHASPV